MFIDTLFNIGKLAHSLEYSIQWSANGYHYLYVSGFSFTDSLWFLADTNLASFLWARFGDFNEYAEQRVASSLVLTFDFFDHDLRKNSASRHSSCKKLAAVEVY